MGLDSIRHGCNRMLRLAHAQVIIGTDNHLVGLCPYATELRTDAIDQPFKLYKVAVAVFQRNWRQPYPAIGSGNPTNPPMLPWLHLNNHMFISPSPFPIHTGFAEGKQQQNRWCDNRAVSDCRMPRHFRISGGQRTALNRAAENFSSGILPNGSGAGLVSWLAGASVKQNSTKIIPFGNLGSTRADWFNPAAPCLHLHLLTG